jgi:hypothetical protein
VLDLTRIIAGPVCGRALAAHGAEVLRVTAGHLPSVAPLVIDTGRGKRSAEIDLRDPAGAATLRALIAEADVFVQGYRPGALAKLGFAPEAAAALRPGLVAVSLSAYGHAGPWAERRGFDSLVQTATGLNALEAEAAGQDRPKPLPCQALDHASGYLMAFGAMAAPWPRPAAGSRAWAGSRVGSRPPTRAWTRSPTCWKRRSPASASSRPCVMRHSSPQRRPTGRGRPCPWAATRPCGTGRRAPDRGCARCAVALS